MMIFEIITEHLKSNGFDGLCQQGCGCELDDLAPCGDFPGYCKPGYKNLCNECEQQEKCELDCKDEGSFCINEEKRRKEL